MISLISISNAETLQQSSKFETFGGFISFTKRTSATIKVSIGDMTDADGTIISEADLLYFQNISDYNTLSINGVLFPRAKITSFNIEGGNWNKEAKASLVIETLEDGQDLTNIGPYWTDYQTAFASVCTLIENLSESVTITRGENATTFNKQMTIKFSNSMVLQGPENPLVKQAQDFAKRIFDYDKTGPYSYLRTNGIGFSETDISNILKNGAYKKFTKEGLNLLTNECSFSQELQVSNIADGAGYAHQATQTFATSKDGITTLSESGEVKGLTEPRLTAAEAGYSTEFDAAKVRLQAMYEFYLKCPAGTITWTGDSKTTDKFSGLISYEITGTDDPNYADSAAGVMSQRQTSISLDAGIYTVTENGTITGLSATRYNSSGSGLGRYTKYQQAITFFDVTKSNAVNTRLGALVVGLSPKPTLREEKHSPWKGEFAYRREFSSNEIYADNDGNYKSVSISTNLTKEAKKVNFFEIINNPTLMQSQAGFTQGSQSISVSMLGYRVSPSVEGALSVYNTFKSYAEGVAQAEAEGDTNKTESAEVGFTFLNDVTFSLDVSTLRGLLEAP
jgi:hypothetical protein